MIVAMDPRIDIEAELARLQQRLAALLAERDGRKAGVLEAFSAEAAPLIARVPAEQAAFVNKRLNCMLAAAGLVAAEAEGEPCPTGLGAEDAPAAPPPRPASRR